MFNAKKSEFEIVAEFSAKLGLKNQTDGSLFIYKNNTQEKKSTKPDGYYYYEGITFILDAKSENGKFTGQLSDYMQLESNTNFIGFEYNGVEFRCYINGKLKNDEKILQDKDYYRNKYFPQKINNELIVNNSAKKLANLFRNSGIDKQMNVPFIGAVILCMKYGKEIDLSGNSLSILQSIRIGINEIITDNPINRRAKKNFIINTVLQDGTLKEAKFEKLYNIIAEISKIYNFINISADDYKGHDIMNNFLKVFRRWNSANANEKGEVFTPDHIAQLMYKLGKCSMDDFILDPTCGSGTFLTNAMANMFNEALNRYSNDKISFQKEQVDIKSNKLFGIELNPFNATLAGINMLLHGDGASNIYNENCFIRLKILNDLYNKVLMNPPFSQEDIELKFVYETLIHMADNGILVSILPKSNINGSTEKNIEYLEKIFEIAKLKAVISLPRDLFYPVGADTCIIVLHKNGSNENNKTILINCLDDGFKVSNETRIDNQNKWENIEREILNAYNGNYDEFRAVEKQLNFNDELLFEAYSSHRPVDIENDIFEKYLREFVSSKILCGKSLIENKFEKSNLKNPFAFKRIFIKDLIFKLEKGKDKSIDRKIENKYKSGIPLIIAKKDNNGIGGLLENPKKIYKDKICIISGGDGGGGKTYYLDNEFCATSFVMICDFVEKYKNISKYAKLYISILISERLFKTIGHGQRIADVPQETTIKLPIKNNDELDIEYMENFIKLFEISKFI